MCMILLVVVALLMVLSALGEAWPILPAVIVIYLAWRAWYAYTEHAQAARKREAQRAHVEQVARHRQQVAYWRGQLAEVDTPAARLAAEHFLAHSQARLRELGAGKETE